MIYLIRPCRGTYMDKHGLRRWLKPNVTNGAYIIGPGTREELSHQRKYCDPEVLAEEMPAPLVEILNEDRRDFICFSADELKRNGWPVPDVPQSGWRRAWWLFRNDDGGCG